MKTVKILQNLIAIDSQNPPGNEIKVVEYLQDFFEKNTKGKCIIQSFENNRSNLLVYFGVRPRYLFNVHLDTVSVGDKNKWLYDPFSGKIQNGKLYGRGACDNKGSLAAIAGAILKNKPENCLFLFSADEEQTGKGIKVFIESDFHKNIEEALVAEPTDREILVAHMGITGLKVSFIGKSVHSSRPEEGENSIYLANHFLNIFQEYYVNILQKEQNEFLGNGVSSIGYIQGGKDTSVLNTVPDYCEVKIDFRYIPEYNADQILWGVQNLVNTDEVLKDKVRVEQIYKFPSFQAGVDNHSMIEIIKKVDSQITLTGARYYTEAADLQEAGINTIVFGAGSIVQAHQVDEYVEVKELEYVEKVYTEIFKRLR
ncbi:hypothetical protein A2X44_01485 [candidate division CPR3 bacterium GWF2_35_18]|uniref:Acetylornithine deacetylase n=1 Tax=candidate division CPR3 bacterium GW2011_GWF2_35_18 TaxID=1618350 RepID=A0A0G0C2N5_UNCC3|nr:MAG: Acetylornithine deacetylase [candidate division CPR3 bacterium GW2011_GWF2_35_18]KKP85415.1 MAG: Acetylornithine deacetylase [candidate division CPR3 bacterium GW2011_GWE2_35_7]OGB63575.1 MAG: hypothetical protein A2X44_01485 [candidate division CPR3 bacterium GWF2_35_18]OGB64684.1 MAG: hypothetical protein A2250_04035 [candidate division CPR3 bacterium RIFOXYA2_FULL_35_13]OGB79078.1 MAG: hypothetical protein A2296_00580 [candidate division CPR3 bacterium RIFOXYB2_FULL_35_8]OGB79882.1 